MMERDNDKLIQDFFAEYKQEIPDKGFSHRVRYHLPDRASKLSILWTSFCACIGIGLFIFFDGVNVLMNVFQEICSSTGNKLNTIEPTYIILTVGILLLIGVHKIISFD